MQGHLIRLLSLSLLKWQKLLLHFYWITRNAALLWQSALSKQSLSSSFTLFCLILSSLSFSLSRSLSPWLTFFSLSPSLSPVSSISLALQMGWAWEEGRVLCQLCVREDRNSNRTQTIPRAASLVRRKYIAGAFSSFALKVPTDRGKLGERKFICVCACSCHMVCWWKSVTVLSHYCWVHFRVDIMCYLISFMWYVICQFSVTTSGFRWLALVACQLSLLDFIQIQFQSL